MFQGKLKLCNISNQTLRNDQPDVLKTDHEKKNVFNKQGKMSVVLFFFYGQTDRFLTVTF